MNRETNFRKAYLTSLGLNAEKINLNQYFDECLNNYPFEITKLRRLIRKFDIPSKWRSLAWQLLLDFQSPYDKDLNEFKTKLKQEEYNELLRTSKILKNGTFEKIDLTSLNLEEPIDRICFVQYTYQLYLEIKIDFHEHLIVDLNNFRMMASVFLYVIQDECSAFWTFHQFLSKHRASHLNEYKGTIMQLQMTFKLLETYDTKLFQHLQTSNINFENFYFKMFQTYFANVLPKESVIKLWDKLIAVSPDLITFFAAMILLTLKTEIHSINTEQELVQLLEKSLPSIPIDSLVSKTMDWMAEYKKQKKLKVSSEIAFQKT